jgi:HSP20 family molecular chaperone IbpA
MAFYFPTAPARSGRHSAVGGTRNDFNPFSLFDDAFGELTNFSRQTSNNRFFTPRFDVREDKEAYHLDGELPGIDQKDVTIEFTDEHTLTIRGRTERHHEEGTAPTEAEEVHDKPAEGGKDKAHQPSVADEKDEEGKSSTAMTTTGSTEVAQQGPSKHQYWISERTVGEFQRSFRFDARVDQDAVKASLKNGILSITVPKSKVSKSRRIQLE